MRRRYHAHSTLLIATDPAMPPPQSPQLESLAILVVSRSHSLLRKVHLPLHQDQPSANNATVYSSLTVGWASTLLALVALVLAPIPWGFARYGSKLRATTKYGPTYSQHQPPPNQYLREFLLGAPRSKFEDPRPAPQPPRPVKFRPRLARQIAFDR